MTTVSSLGFPSAPVDSGEATNPARDLKCVAASFDEFLSGSTEPGATATSTPQDANEAIEPELENDGAPGRDDSDKEATADAMMLSSCVGLWQILPPPVVAPLSPVELSGEIGVTDEKVLADGPTPIGPDAGGNAAPANVLVATSETAEGGKPSAPEQATETPAANFPTPTTPAQPVSAKETTVPVEAPPTAPVPATAPADPSRGATAVRAGKGLEIKGSPVEAAPAEVPRAGRDGIPVAKEHRAMSEPIFHYQAKPAQAVVAEGEKPVEAMPESRPESVAAIPVAEDSREGNASGQHESHSNEAFLMSAGPEGHRETELSKSATKVTTTDTAHVIHEIERAMDRMRAQGGQRMEMRLPMQDGQEVVVKLRIEQGEVKATFQAGSEELRSALERGWSQFTQTSVERAAKNASVVLETPSLQSGMGGFQQSAEHRGRQWNETPADFATRLTQPESRKPFTPRPTEPAAARVESPIVYA